MLLSQTAEYALRATAYLATADARAGATASQIARATSIPAHYVSKVMRKLVEANIVYGQRGHHGGFRLVRPPADVRFSDVLSAVDASIDTGRCVSGLARCGDHPCPLHDAYGELKGAVARWAEQQTFAGPASRKLNLVKP